MVTRTSFLSSKKKKREDAKIGARVYFYAKIGNGFGKHAKIGRNFNWVLK